ncbi:MAG: 30S ribosomal protein S5 [Candidatus Freyrarchaeum guaymaensis]|nr:30S ribosomal protein S5 [Candidatus Sigynarchaeota archaeon]
MAQAEYEEEWQPRTRVGLMVKEGLITSIEEIFQQSLRIMEPQIVDILLPGLEEEVIDINLVQKQTDAGEKSRFKATVAVGNGNGYIGIGEAKATEIGPAIRKAIVGAKMNIIPVRRGCGSWECGCGDPHSLPFKVWGKSGSVELKLIPAPRGVGLVASDVARVILRLAGISDIWSWSRGHTKTTVNFAYATFNALKKTYEIMHPKDWVRS